MKSQCCKSEWMIGGSVRPLNWISRVLRRQLFVGMIAAGVVLAALANRAYAVGATTPFTNYEAEAGTLGGGATIIAQSGSPTTQYSSPQLEASGRSYVNLATTGDSVTWTNGTSQNFGAINIRFMMPDAPNGGGITATLDLYVNGVLRQAVSMSSAQTWLYEGVTYHSNSNNPADGNPYRFWDEIPVLITGAAVAPGSTITLKKDAANSAAYYGIDCVDLEPLPTAITQPANSLSITSYGAVANDSTVDSTTAIQNCINAAQTSGQVVWVPQGTFYLNQGYPGLNTTGPVTIQGAGLWYSTLYHNTLSVPHCPNGSVIQAHGSAGTVVKNLSIDCNAVSGDCNDGGGGGFNMVGSNWLLDTVWMRHTTTGVWASGTGGTVQNSRMNNTWGDGINLNNLNDGVGNSLTATNNFIRASGDDGIAINSVAYNGTTTYAQMQNASVTYNTSIAPVWANCLRIAGGQNDVVQNNLLCDGVKTRGLFVSEFGANGQPLNGANVTGNTILRCGGNAYNSNYASVDLGGRRIIKKKTNVTFGTNTINGCYFNWINIETLSGTNTLSNNLVNYPAQKGIYIQTGESGTASLTSNTVSNLNTGQVAYQNDSPSTFPATLTNNSWQTSPPPPPAPPTGLAATAVSTSQINLSWTASSGATSYNVKRATVSGGPYTTIPPGVTATSYNDTGLAARPTYYNGSSSRNTR